MQIEKKNLSYAIANINVYLPIANNALRCPIT